MRRARELERVFSQLRSAAAWDVSTQQTRRLAARAVSAQNGDAEPQDRSNQPGSSKRSWWVLALSAAAAAAAAVPQHALNGNETLEPEALQELAQDLGAKYGTTDRERAVSMLSGLTIFLEHHDALLDAGIFPALMAAMLDAAAVPQVRAIALGCTADLLKDTRARRAAAAEAAFIPTLLDALKSRAEWAEGPEEGGVARAQAARALAELSGEPGLHALLARSGAAAALAEHGAQLSAESDSEDKTYASLAEVPGTVVERHAVEDERFTAAGMYGLASTQAGVDALLAAGPTSSGRDAVQAMGRWAASNDPVLQRYGVGGLARIAVSSPDGFRAVVDADALKHLVRALGCADAQVRCFAAGAIGHLAEQGSPAVEALLEHEAAPRLLGLLEQKFDAESVTGKDSPGVRRGVYRCALRALLRGLRNATFREALKRAGGANILKDFLGSADASVDPDLRAMAEAILGALQE